MKQRIALGRLTANEQNFLNYFYSFQVLFHRNKVFLQQFFDNKDNKSTTSFIDNLLSYNLCKEFITLPHTTNAEEFYREMGTLLKAHPDTENALKDFLTRNVTAIKKILNDEKKKKNKTRHRIMRDKLQELMPNVFTASTPAKLKSESSRNSVSETPLSGSNANSPPASSTRNSPDSVKVPPQKYIVRVEQKDDALTSLEQKNHLIIYGPPGAGKQMLAKQCLSHYNDNNYSTVTVRCESRELFDIDCRNLAKQLGYGPSEFKNLDVTEVTQLDLIIEFIRKELGATDASWIILLSNITNDIIKSRRKELKALVDATKEKSHKIIITTQYRTQVKSICDLTHVNALDLSNRSAAYETAIQAKYEETVDRNKVLQLLAAVRYTPYLVDLSLNSLVLPHYDEILNALKEISDNPNKYYHTILSIVFDRALAPCDKEIIYICSFFGPTLVPFKLFETASEWGDSSITETAARQASYQLKTAYLIDKEELNDGFHVRDVIKQTAQELLLGKKEDFKTYLSKAIHTISARMVDGQGLAFIAELGQIVPHACALMTHVEKNSDLLENEVKALAVRIYTMIATYFARVWNLEKMLKYIERAENFLSHAGVNIDALDKHHKMPLTHIENLHCWYTAVKKTNYAEGIEFGKVAIEKREALVGDYHSATVAAKTNLAENLLRHAKELRLAGKTDQVETLLEKYKSIMQDLETKYKLTNAKQPNAAKNINKKDQTRIYNERKITIMILQARLLRFQNQLQQAFDVYKSIAEYITTRMDAQHTYLPQIYLCMGRIQYHLDNQAKNNYFRESLEECEKIFAGLNLYYKNNKPAFFARFQALRLVKALYWLAKVNLAQNEVGTAYHHIESCLSLQHEILGKDSAHFVKTFSLQKQITNHPAYVTEKLSTSQMEACRNIREPEISGSSSPQPSRGSSSSESSDRRAPSSQYYSTDENNNFRQLQIRILEHLSSVAFNKSPEGNFEIILPSDKSEHSSKTYAIFVATMKSLFPQGRVIIDPGKLTILCGALNHTHVIRFSSYYREQALLMDKKRKTAAAKAVKAATPLSATSTPGANMKPTVTEIHKIISDAGNNYQDLFAKLAKQGWTWDQIKQCCLSATTAESDYTTLKTTEEQIDAKNIMEQLIDARMNYDGTIYERAVKQLFPDKHYRVHINVKGEAQTNAAGFKIKYYELCVYDNGKDRSYTDIDLPRPQLTIRIIAPGSKELTSDVDTTIRIAAGSSIDPSHIAWPFTVTSLDEYDLESLIQTSVIACFNQLSVDDLSITAGESRDSNAYSDDALREDVSAKFKRDKFDFDPEGLAKEFTNPNHWDEFYAKEKQRREEIELAASLALIYQYCCTKDQASWKKFKSNLKRDWKERFSDPQTQRVFFESLDSVFKRVEAWHSSRETDISSEAAKIAASNPNPPSTSYITARLYVERLKVVARKRGKISKKEAFIEAKKQNLTQLLKEVNDLSPVVEALKTVHQQDLANTIAATSYDQTNAILTEKTSAITKLRTQIKESLVEHAQLLIGLQEAVAVANLMADEAYTNRSAPYHVVNWKQMGGSANINRRQMVMGSVLQQIGFRLLHAHRLKGKLRFEEILWGICKYGVRVLGMVCGDDKKDYASPLTEDQIDRLASGQDPIFSRLKCRFTGRELKRTHYAALTLDALLTDAKTGSGSYFDRMEKTARLFRKFAFFDSHSGMDEQTWRAFPKDTQESELARVSDDDLQNLLTNEEAWLELARITIILAHESRLKAKCCLWGSPTRVAFFGTASASNTASAPPATEHSMEHSDPSLPTANYQVKS